MPNPPLTNDNRLSHLKSFLRLSDKVQVAVRLHLLVGLDVPTACKLVGVRNPDRAWSSPRVAECLSDYHGTDEEKTVDELVAEFERADLEAAKAKWLIEPPIKPSEPIGGTPTPTTDQREPISRPREPIQETPIKPEDTSLIPQGRFLAVQSPSRSDSREVVLGGEAGIDTHELFRGIDSANLREWRRQIDAEQTERRALINIIEARRGN